jgi:hypothetical protein
MYLAHDMPQTGHRDEQREVGADKEEDEKTEKVEHD